MDAMARLRIREEEPSDVDAIRDVNRLTFGQDAEGRLVDQLRGEGYARVSLVAEVNGRIVGHILFSELPVMTDAQAIPAVALAPMAVVPDHQRQGIGSALVRAGLEGCRTRGFRVAVVLGHRAFYPRFGFSALLARQIAAPFSGEDFMAIELEAGAMKGARGRVTYPPPFAEV